jgi:hypothetical protein
MALMNCADCGHQCSTKALACPQCGRMFRARGWWAMTVGWGMIASVLISFLLTVGLLIAGVAFMGGLGALGAYNQRQARPANQEAAPVASPTVRRY